MSLVETRPAPCSAVSKTVPLLDLALVRLNQVAKGNDQAATDSQHALAALGNWLASWLTRVLKDPNGAEAVYLLAIYCRVTSAVALTAQDVPLVSADDDEAPQLWLSFDSNPALDAAWNMRNMAQSLLHAECDIKEGDGQAPFDADVVSLVECLMLERNPADPPDRAGLSCLWLMGLSWYILMGGRGDSRPPLTRHGIAKKPTEAPASLPWRTDESFEGRLAHLIRSAWQDPQGHEVVLKLEDLCSDQALHNANNSELVRRTANTVKSTRDKWLQELHQDLKRFDLWE
ncbi:hypothetical protein ml_74 [Mollivirus sibericum]|uniref:hypothetical protein n=1 Tax=Mollivirus sibericum TaxID=1678078 RepID=UPI0006B2E3E7|nr:hypothetical protein ml_74 [Mollivirus sibericum]ALD61876.1 hypothetical protein ml_74 [Mollivirus sibericum]